jgi:mRNA degradation ribonuclease J1/J2/transcriptional regulator with XRE-family HTH domain
MTSLTFYGGVDEIGGNKILLEDKDTKILFDFGMSFGRRGMFFEEFLNPRSAAGLKDFLKMGLIPDIKGAYREDLVKTIGRKKEDVRIDAVFLTHAHADHANYISFLHRDIPVYCGETCLLLLKAVHESTQRSIENEVIDFKPRPILDYRKPPIERVFKTFRTGDRIKVGDVEVIPVHVDHCLTEDTFIQLSNGTIAKVKDVTDSGFINAMDMKTGRIVQAMSSKTEHKASQIFRIKTRFGEIKSTGEHKFFCLNGVEIVEKKAKELKNNDFLIYTKYIPFEGEQQQLPKIKVRKVVNVSKNGLEIIKAKRKKRGLTQIQLARKIGLSKFYGDFERGRFNIELKRLKNILKFLKINEKIFIQKFVSETNTSIVIPNKTSPELLQLLGYVIGDGSWYSKSNKSPYVEIADKDIENLKFYQKIAKSLFNVKGKIARKERNKLRLSAYIGRLFYKISPLIFSKSQTRAIPELVHRATKKEIAAFLRGLYDAEGSFGNHAILLTSTSKDIINVTKLLLLRFGILSWVYEFIEPISKCKAYQLTITHNRSILRFDKNIGFSSKAKKTKLKKFLLKNKKSNIERIDLIPFAGEFLKKALNDMKITSWDFQKSKINLGHYMKGKHLPSRKKLTEILDFLKKCESGDKEVINQYVQKIEHLLSLEVVFVPVKSIEILDEDPVVYDFEVPAYSNFIANGFLVHNSVPGAYGFIIHTTEGSVAYTGDFRFHGTHAEMTEDFINAAAKSRPKALITEGTRIDVPKDDSSEAKVRKECNKIVSETGKLVVADFNFKDVDRLRTFYNIAKENNRTFVITLKDACFLSHLAKDKKLGLPNLRNDSIAVYQPRRRSGMYNENDYRPWERVYLRGNVVRAESINKNQGKYITALTFYSINELIDIDPEPDSIYIHSLSEPFNEETELDFKRLKNWVKHFRMRFFQSHCSGHASGDAIKEVVKRVNAKRVFPIHTEKPKLFKNLNKNVRFVENNKTYKI